MLPKGVWIVSPVYVPSFAARAVPVDVPADADAEGLAALDGAVVVVVVRPDDVEIGGAVLAVAVL